MTYLQLTDEGADRELPVDGTNGCIGAFRMVLEERFPTIKLILSVREAAGSQNFDEVTYTNTRLERMVHTSRKLVDDLGMNGIDIVWIHPLSEDQSQQYIRLLGRLRDAMPSPQYLLTTAVPTGTWALRNMNIGKVSQLVDMINVMAYDFIDPSAEITQSGHHAQLRCPQGAKEGIVAAKTSEQTATQFLLEQGVAREKILLGVPLYGRSFLGATGPGQPFNGDGGQEGGIFEYRHLPITEPDGHRGGQSSDADAITPCAEQFDPDREVAWCVGPQLEDRDGFITYDNATSVEAKAKFVKEEGLGGMFYWHIGFDKPKGEGSLVDVGGNALCVGQKKSSWSACYP